MFALDISRERFYRLPPGDQRSGLTPAIGRYWRVTPPPLAIRLAHEWLLDALPDTKERLFNDLPESLADSLAKRFHEISTPTAVQAGQELSAPNGRFGTLDGIIGSGNADFVYALSEVDPGFSGLRSCSDTIAP